jgi:polyferredoxin
LQAAEIEQPPAEPVREPKIKKPYIKRTLKDRSQQIRRTVQVSFLLLNIWLGTQFYFFVRHYEQYAAGSPVSRPAGIEGWLPIAGLMNLKAFILTGDLPQVHPAAMFLLVCFLGISLLLRKAFCGWLCPVGTISEYLWKFGRKTLRRNWALPRWFDLTLRSLKYVLLALFGYAVASMDVEGIEGFLTSPYGLIADVKMLNFFRHLGVTAAIVLGTLMALSIFVQNFWCRYLCPYGALNGLFSLLSPTRIRRNPDACIDCAKCAKACPSKLPVDTLIQIRSAECLGCLECVAICPAENALDLSILGAKPLNQRTPSAVAAGIALLFFGIVGYAKVTNNWNTHVPAQLYERLIPNADDYGHPH